MALFGGIDFSKKYLSGWRFEKTDEDKGSKAGFMMDLPLALKNSLKKAEDMWKEAKEKLTKLVIELEQGQTVLEAVEEFLQEAINHYEVAAENRKEKQHKAEQAHAALKHVAFQTEALETKVQTLKYHREREEHWFKTANAALKVSWELLDASD